MSEENISETSTEVANAETVAPVSKKEKKSKAPKMVGVKKLPSLFRKSYTEKAFSKKILSKIYIEEDRKLVESIFTDKITKNKKGVELKTPLIAVPKTSKFPKTEVKKLKLIGKAIRKNRGRVRWIPLAVIAGVIAAIVLLVSAFINPIAKTAIKMGCESAFGAKTDVGYVKVNLFGISVTVGNLAVGDKDSKEFDYKKNLFEFEKLNVAFNFTQALRGNLIAENLSVTGIRMGTDRTTSCYIPVPEKKEEKPAEESAFMKELNAKSSAALEDLKSMANDMLGGSDVNEIVANIQKQLQTPKACENAKNQSLALVAKWKETPEIMKADVDKFAADVKKFQNIDMSQFQNHPEKVALTVAEITKTINSMNEMKLKVEATMNDIKADGETIKNLGLSLSEAVQADKDLAASRLNAATSAISNANKIFTDALESVAYSLLGKYYPYVKKGIGYAVKMKQASENSGKNDKKEKKGATGRLRGRNIQFTRTYPAFWIKNVSATGTLENLGLGAFSAAISNVTNDQNLTGNPTSAKASLEMGGMAHSALLSLDVRKNSDAALITAEYEGKGFAANVNGASIATGYGVPSVNGVANISLKGTAGENGFSAGGKVGLSPLTLTSDGFASPIVTKYYQEALAAVKSIELGYDFAYSENNGISMALLGDFSDVFANMLKTAAMSFANDAKDAAFKMLNDQISSLNMEGLGKLGEFNVLKDGIDLQNLNLQNFQKILTDKIAELQKAGSGNVPSQLQNLIPASSGSEDSKNNPLGNIFSGAKKDSSSADKAPAENAPAASEKKEETKPADPKDAISTGLKTLFGGKK